MTVFTINFLIEPLRYHKIRAAETGHAAHVLKTALYNNLPPFNLGGLKLLLSSLNAGLELLDVLLGLGHQGLFIIKLGRQHLGILLLVADGVLNVSLRLHLFP